MAREHVVFLAIADARGDLPELREESRKLQGALRKVPGRRTMLTDLPADGHLGPIYQVLTTQPDDIAIFHFGGHADEGQVLLDSHLGAASVASEGLASSPGRRRNLKLVFLNGCSTRPQVQLLLDAGVLAVIATARPIDDRAACDVAVAFYEALTAGGEAAPAGGRSLRSAWNAGATMSLVRYPKTAATATCSPFTAGLFHSRIGVDTSSTDFSGWHCSAGSPPPGSLCPRRSTSR